MFQKIAWLIVALAVSITWARDSRAACTNSESPHGNTSGEKNYRVNLGSFSSHITRFGSLEGQAAVIAAADTWNEQADGGHFRYRGITTLTDIPETKAACDAQGVDFSLVTVISDGCTSIDGATTFARCIDSATGKGTQFVVKINSRAYVNHNCVEQLWSVGDITSTEWDLVSVVTHELGHTLKLGHSGSEFGVMQGGGIEDSGGTLIRRDLYEWDRKCVNQISGRRSLAMYGRYVSGGSWLSSELPVTNGVPAPAGGVIKLASGTWDWSHVWEQPLAQGACLFWHQGANNVCIRNDSDSLLWSTGHRDVVFRENENRQFVLFAQNTETPQNSPFAKFPVSFDYSDDLFSSKASGTVQFCTDSACEFLETLYTGKAVSVAWDNFNNRSITAWVRQDRENSWQDRNLLLSFSASSGILGPTVEVGVKSSVSPGIACQAFQAGGFDCILAYVDESDSLYGVKLRRFWWSWSSSSPVWDSGLYDVGVATSSAIAAFFHNGAFYVAVRSMGGGQYVIVRKSTDGAATWSTDTGFPLSYSATGPQAVSYWTNNNQLFMVH